MVHHYHEDKKEPNPAKLRRAVRKYTAVLESVADRVQPANWKWSSAASFQAQRCCRQVVCMLKRSCKSTDCRSDLSPPQFSNFTVKITPPKPKKVQLTCLTASIFLQEVIMTNSMPARPEQVSSEKKPRAPQKNQVFHSSPRVRNHFGSSHFLFSCVTSFSGYVLSKCLQHSFGVFQLFSCKRYTSHVSFSPTPYAC